MTVDRPGPGLKEILEKAGKFEGLFPEEVERIFAVARPGDWKDIFDCARDLTQKSFHRKLWFFAPLYFSSFCLNDCLYCGFRRTNRLLGRKALTSLEFAKEAWHLWNEGHRSILLIAGEHPVYAGPERIAEYLSVLQRENLPFSVAVEVGPLDLNGYRCLREWGVKQCLLFQETYHPGTYVRLHDGPKKNFEWRLEAMERAVSGGIERVGLGILLGLHSFREDLAALIGHAWQFKKRFGFFPATFSFPRLRPAYGVPPFPVTQEAVSDEDFVKIIAVARIAMPSVGIVLTTRESPAFRDQLLKLGIGITHVSAGSSTLPGGYTLEPASEGGQFNLLDHRRLREVEQVVSGQGYESVFSLGASSS